MGKPRRKICFSHVNVVLAAEFSVDSLGFVFSSDKSELAHAVGSAYCACFCKHGFEVFVRLQDCFADVVFVRFELRGNFDDGYVAYYVQCLRQTCQQMRRQLVFENLHESLRWSCFSMKVLVDNCISGTWLLSVANSSSLRLPNQRDAEIVFIALNFQ